VECVLCRTGEVCPTGDAGFGPATKAHGFFCTKSQNCPVGDITGDNKADLIAFTRGANPRVFVGISQ
jgi:hypothetical protein